MQQLQTHLRNTFLAGIFAAIPVAVTVFIIYKVDLWTRGIALTLFGQPLPFVGALIAIVAIYLTGLIVTISLGKMVLGMLDRALGRIPLLRPLYQAWKQIALTPGGGEGMFAKVVLLPGETGQMTMLGFTNGLSLPGDANSICVFVPNAPNPIQGKLYFVAKDNARFLSVSADEAFKVLLSTGNYIPNDVTGSQPG